MWSPFNFFKRGNPVAVKATIKKDSIADGTSYKDLKQEHGVIDWYKNVSVREIFHEDTKQETYAEPGDIVFVRYDPNTRDTIEDVFGHSGRLLYKLPDDVKERIERRNIR